MASAQETRVPVKVKTQVQRVDIKTLHRQGTGSRYQTSDDFSIVEFHPALQQLYGREPQHSLLVSLNQGSKNPFFHGACVYADAREELYITSNFLQSTSSSRLPVILISQLKLKRKSDSPWDTLESIQWTKLRPPPSMPMPAGACRYKNGIVYCSQGTLSSGTGGLYYMPFGRPPEPLITNYFGRDFNSVQDVVPSSDSVLWFTDSTRGFENEIRPPPGLPNHVYRYDIKSGELRVVANDLYRPSGIAVSNDRKTLYVSDLGALKSDGSLDRNSPAGIYAFDIQDYSGSQFLVNKRLFAYPRKGSAIRLYCDGRRNVLAACGDGVEVWGSDGVLLGVFEVPGGASSFWINDQEMFICSEQRLWWMEVV